MSAIQSMMSYFLGLQLSKDSNLTYLSQFPCECPHFNVSKNYKYTLLLQNNLNFFVAEYQTTKFSKPYTFRTVGFLTEKLESNLFKNRFLFDMQWSTEYCKSVYLDSFTDSVSKISLDLEISVHTSIKE